MERCLNKIKNAIIAQDPPLMMAQTRLKKRNRRPEVENCNDEVHHRLIQGVAELKENIKLLEGKMEESRMASEELSKNKERLDQDIRVKRNSIMVDFQMCMSKRRTFPYNIVLLLRPTPVGI